MPNSWLSEGPPTPRWVLSEITVSVAPPGVAGQGRDREPRPWRGRLVVVGFASGRIPGVKVNYLLVKNIEISGLQVSDYRKRTPALMAQCVQEIFAMYEAGKLKPAATVTYPLEAFAKALQDVVDRRVSGRIVLLPNP